MRQSLLRNVQMSAVSFVDDARDRARWLVDHESRGSGDTRNAMERIARRYRIPFSQLWALRYREPKDILVTTYFAILAAHEAECERQARLLNEERQKTMPTSVAGRLLVRAAAALGGAQGEALNKP